jgi:poly-gamma-glutamate synthesis protein (capsule biosynthesis protein)
MSKKKKMKFRNKYAMYSFFALLVLLCLLTYFSYNIFFKEKESTDKENKEEEKNVEEKIEVKEPVIEESELSLIMVGDCLIHGAIYLDAQEGNTYNFYKMIDKIKPIISKYDLAFYNQESLLGGTSLGLSSYPRFNAPQEVGDAFLDAGFNLVSFANNHALDMGEKGILSSLNYWKDKQEKGIMTAGSYASFEDREKDVIMEKNGIKYTLLSYTTTTNGLPVPKGKEYLVNVYNYEQAKKDIERLRDKVDLLMVAMHWGEEYTHTPVEEQKQIANELAMLGVDIIIGHHPHVIQPIDFIDNTMVIYSLGNFIASQKGAVEKHTGLMASVTVHKKTVDGKSEITLLNPTAELEYVYSIPNGSNSRYGYELYPYSELNDNLLKGYKEHFKKFMDIVTKYSDKINYKEI